MKPTIALPFVRSLQFEPGLETEFQAEYTEKFTGLTRMALLFSAIVMALFGLLDVWSAPNEIILHQLWAIRYLVICPAFLLGLAWTFHVSYRRWMQFGVSLTVITAGLAIAMMVAMARREDAAFNTYYVGMILITLGIYTFIRLRFWYALVSSLVIMAGYEMAALFFQGLLYVPMGTSTFVTANFFFISANLVGGFASYYLELYTRRDFLQRKTIELEKAKSENALQREAAEALSQSEARYRTLIETSDSGISIITLDGVIRYVNPAYENILGYPAHELTNLPYASLIHPDDLGQAGEIFSQLFAHPDQPTYATVRARHKDGTWRWLEGTARVMPDGNLVVYNRDITQRKQTEEKLRLAERRFRAVFEQPLLSVRIYSPEGNLIEWNTATQQMVKATAEQMQGVAQTYNLLNDPDAHQLGYINEIQRAFDGQAVNFPPLQRTFINGEQTWVATYLYPVKDDDGNVRELVSISQDVTLQQEAEQKLRESEEYYRSLIENSSDGITVLEADGVLGFVSPALARMFGYTVEEMTGQTFAPFIVPEHLPATAEHFQNILANPGQPITTEIYARHKDGSTVIVENVAQLHPNGKIISNSRDITDRKQAEEELRRLNDQLEQRVEERTAESKRLAAIIEAMPDYVGIADLQGNSLYVNRAGRRLMGKPETDTAPWNVIQCYPPEDMAQLHPMLTAMQLGESWAGELDLRHLAGHRIPTDHVVFPLHNADGQIESYAAVIRDITERKRAEEEIHRAKEAADEARAIAETANKAKSTFLANMSHEIRTPMNAVIGMTGLLLNTPLNEKQRDFVETIRTSGDALLTIINDILDFSKIEAGKMDLVQRPLDLRACIESALDLLAPRAAEKGLELAYVMEDGVPAGILGDDTRLRQILVNLIGNAIKFTERGEVVVSVSCKQLSVSSKASSTAHFSLSTLHFSVQDTGIGIDPAKLDRLFQSFSQIDSSATREYGGTGLGLAISKRLSELMGGTMWAESAGAGQGSTFHFTLQAQTAPAPVRSHLQNRQPLLVGKRILIVDDNPTNRRILTLQTQTWGMEPVEAATPSEALDILHQDRPFDLAILDMHMPEMDGASLAAAMCAEHERQGHHFPLVLLTSLGYETRPELEDIYCFSAYLTKPVKPSQLYDVLVSVLVDEEREARRAQSLEPITESSLARLSEKLSLRILLAEDVAINQKFALLALDEMGYTADVAANGLEALDALKRQPYDVILMDVQMPEMDGLTATRHIRADFPADRQPRIVAMTANAMQGDRELCLEAGMDDYISKPVYLEELQAALERAGQWLNNQRRKDMTPILTETDAPILDQIAFNKILRYSMSEDLIAAYLEEAQALVGSLEQAVSRADAHTIRERAHALKGSSSYIGAQRVRVLSNALEQAGKTEILTNTPHLFTQLLEAHRQTRMVLLQQPTT